MDFLNYIFYPILYTFLKNKKLNVSQIEDNSPGCT